MIFTKNKQRGAVSLFIVIFSALLIITIVTAFVRIMLQDQQQATASDLSKSALDSAHAGVEDAKRAIVEYYKNDCATGNSSSRCNQLRDVLIVNVDDNGWTQGCKATQNAGVATSATTEVKVESHTSDTALDQAYTCVKVQMYPENYIGNEFSRFIKLKPKSGETFNKIKIDWYEQKDDSPVGLMTPGEFRDDWPVNVPQVMRVQLLRHGANFTLGEFDDNASSNATLFLTPSVPKSAADQPASGAFSDDIRKNSASGSKQPAGCITTPARGTFACSIILDVPTTSAIDGAYLKVDQLFASSSNKKFSVQLLNDDAASGTVRPVRLTDAQAVVDVTGRANDLFKRIQSRVDIGGNIPAPDAAVDVTRSFCKEFMVTDTLFIPGSHSTYCPTDPSY